MLEAISFKGMLEEVEKNRAFIKGSIDTIGILLTRPNLKTGKDIIDSLNYYHHRSGENINFFLPGYCAYASDEYPDEIEVNTIDGVNWYYSDKMFAKFINELEMEWAWQYSEESELMLIEVNENGLDYKNGIVIYVDRVLSSERILSVHKLLGYLFLYSRRTNVTYLGLVNNAYQVFGIDNIKMGLLNDGYEKGVYWEIL